MAKNNYYFDPLMGPKQNAMKMRADIIETQLDEKGNHAKDIMAAKEAEKSKKKGFFARFKKKK